MRSRPTEMTTPRLKTVATAAAVLIFCALPANADDLRIQPGMILCPTAKAVARQDHAGCWRAAGGQQVEVIARLPHYAQLRIWSSDGTETAIAWSTAEDADRIQEGSKP